MGPPLPPLPRASVSDAKREASVPSNNRPEVGPAQRNRGALGPGFANPALKAVAQVVGELFPKVLAEEIARYANPGLAGLIDGLPEGAWKTKMQEAFDAWKGEPSPDRVAGLLGAAVSLGDPIRVTAYQVLAADWKAEWVGAVAQSSPDPHAFFHALANHPDVVAQVMVHNRNLLEHVLLEDRNLLDQAFNRCPAGTAQRKNLVSAIKLVLNSGFVDHDPESFRLRIRSVFRRASADELSNLEARGLDGRKFAILCDELMRSQAFDELQKRRILQNSLSLKFVEHEHVGEASRVISGLATVARSAEPAIAKARVESMLVRGGHNIPRIIGVLLKGNAGAAALAAALDLLHSPAAPLQLARGEFSNLEKRLLAALARKTIEESKRR